MKYNNTFNEEIDNPIFSEIIKILKLDEKQISELITREKKEGFSSLVSSILRKNKSNKALVRFLLKDYKGNIFSIISSEFQNDKEIVNLAIKQNSNNYFLLSEVLKKDINVGKILAESFVREGKSFLELEPIVEKYFTNQKYKNIILNTFSDYIEKAENIYIDDFSKGMILIEKTNKQFYKYLVNNKIVLGKGNKIVVAEKFKKGFIDELSNDKEYNLLNFEDKIVFEKKYLAKKLNINISLIDSDSLFIFNSVLNLSLVFNNKRIINAKKEENIEEKNKVKEKEIGKNTKKEKLLDNSSKGDYDDKMNFCLPSCSYICSSSGDYTISTNGNISVKLSKIEMDRFTSEGLKNFIKFYNTLYDLGLNFLWDSNKDNFVNILNNTIGFNYPDGQGITESRGLRVLNFIGKSIGLIGFKDSQYQKEFNTFGGAKLAFGNVKSDGKIGNKTYETVGQFANPVKSALKDLGYIGDGGGLNISKFYNIGESLNDNNSKK